MQYQAEMLAQVLRLAQAKALELVQAAPARLEVEAVLLQQEVQAVLRQAVALQQLAALPEVPLELGLPQEALQQLEVEVRQGWEQAAQRALAGVMAQAEAGGWAVAQAMEQVDLEQELVQAPLLAEDWVGWVKTEKE